MPAMNRTFARTSVPKPSLFQSSRHSLSTSTFRARESHFRRSDFQSQGFTGTYEPGQPTVGPLGQASKHGAPRLTPSLLKEHLDKYVVGQDKAKKVTAVAIYNHYQRIRELQRQEDEEQARREQEARWELRERERTSHPVENEYPGHVETVDLNAPLRSPDPEPELGTRPLQDDSKTIIEKSNILLLGPSGVGKTYILSTLARVLEVPFATVDCSSLTQAGYIGTDIESSIERLLLAASHSITKCETGIIFFDEVDKLAKPAIMTHGRDVSGEGVQQGLLKMIEGTTVTVNAKSDRSSKSESNSRGADRIERGSRDGQQSTGKSEQYTIDTTNILFVFAGAFVGLEKIISSRLSSGSSIGFGAQLKSPSPSNQKKKKQEPKILEAVTPTDLQTYGLIPELLGRIPITVALSPLSLPQLVSILTEPKNSLTKQFIALFHTYGIQLKFTTGALHAIAERALPPTKGDAGKGGGGGGGIGARGLRSILEAVLGETMFWGPGSAIRFCLVDEKFVRRVGRGVVGEDGGQGEEQGEDEHKMPRCWSRGQGRAFEEAYEVEEEEWRVRHEGAGAGEGKGEDASFERLRRVGSSGM
ncbi:P-loop containing nucleoside triphosphate hydrolase protein [Mollisia scopiformis]|uniref:p-loop containing nucleoside triphosphate hydrolase protein n=1 Tax=Mollisia scopiformis TaxID=149040 RepID=A0A132B9C6_MOLSC|nr:P-loop containing nucleoside triphosphate hydrolase protein [Mollisia scopiformis]KUJ09008.1 P-loop containing nucleoside triphosphate hydrolase protein [Mollisia scopiformis]